jgi:hypothetical protein
MSDWHDDELIGVPDPRLSEVLEAYNRPPPAPLEQMWRVVERTCFGATVHALPVRSRWMPMGLAAAAALVLGVVIGHFGPMPGGESAVVADAGLAPPSLVSPVADTTHDGAFQAVDAAYNMTANRFLGETAALLAVLPGMARIEEEGVAQQVDAHFASQAGELLSTTRMLLASPAMEDPQFHDLLSDLELVLAQVAGLSSNRSIEELRLITAAVRQRDVISRLRRATLRTADADVAGFDVVTTPRGQNGRSRTALEKSM